MGHTNDGVSPGARSTDEGRVDDTRAVSDDFLLYLVKRLIGDRRFSEGAPEETARLVELSDAMLSLPYYGLSLVAIIDRRLNSSPGFLCSQKELIEIGRACLKYTGTLNGSKMPVGITLYEIGSGPPTEADRHRMKAVRRSIPGLTKVAIGFVYIDIQNKKVWTPAPLDALLRGRRWIDKVVRRPQKRDDEIFVPDAALPSDQRPPFVTAALLASLALVFGVERFFGHNANPPTGILGLDWNTLVALGGMNADAVIHRGEWYRLITAAFLHADLIHLFSNSIPLALTGYLIEKLVGPFWLLSLFFLGAFGGSLMGLAVQPPGTVSVGASGAVMGLLAAAFITATRYPRGVERTRLQIRLLAFLVPSLIPLTLHDRGEHIDYAAHFGGTILGGIAGYAITKLWRRHEERPQFERASRGLATFAVGCSIVCLGMSMRNFRTASANGDTSASSLLIDGALIPKDDEAASRDVDIWGKDYPRDPRVHYYRAVRYLDEGNEKLGEVELRAALKEAHLLNAAFGDNVFESGVRVGLCVLLLHEGKEKEARDEARPICGTKDTALAEELHKLNICD